jgi:hypothetical protein
MKHKEKAKEMAEHILSALNKKDDPIKELLVVYLEKKLIESYDDGLKHGGQPF